MIVLESIGNFIIDYVWVVIVVLLVMNLVTLFTYMADKSKAKRGAWRIPEATLIGLSWAFGSVGALIGMYVFRHKTKHIKFTILVPLSFIVHLIFFIVCPIVASLA